MTEIIVERQPYFVVETPYPPVPKVACMADTWMNHVVASGRIDQIARAEAEKSAQEMTTITLEDPGNVCLGTTNPSYVIFVSDRFFSPNSQAPFAVVVDPNSTPMPLVASIGYKGGFRRMERRTILWTPSR